MEAKLQQAKARVGALQGWRFQYDDKALKFLGSQNLPHIEMKLKDIALPADALKAVELDPKALQDYIKVNPEVWPRKAAPKEKKPAESLEQKLDRLMKEVEELRKEIRKDKPSAYYQPIK